MLQPKLRFKEFSEKWQEKKLEEVTSYIDYRGKTPAKTENGIFLVTAKNIKKGFIDYNSSKEYVSSQSYDEVMKRGKPQIGDVLLTTEAPLGNVAQVDKQNIALAQRVIKFRGKEKLLDNTFLKYIFLSEGFQTLLRNKAIGTTVLGIQGKVLHKLVLYISRDLKEQKKIADFLSAVDVKLNLTEKKLELLKEYKKGIMQKIFNQELRFKDNNGNDYPKWEEKKLGNISLISAGGDIKKENFSEEKTNEFKFSVYANSLDKKGLYGYSNIFKVTGESITVTARGNIGVATYRNENYIPIVRLLVIKMDSTKYSHKYFSYFINTIKIIQEVTGVPQLTAPQLKEYKVIYPISLEEQQKIADFLSSIDNKIEKIADELENLKEFKKGLLQQMFV